MAGFRVDCTDNTSAANLAMGHVSEYVCPRERLELRNSVRAAATFQDHTVYLQDTFIEALIEDLNRARALVLLQSPFVALPRLAHLEPAIKGCVQRKVRVCAFVQRPKNPNMYTNAALNALAGLGVHLNFREEVHEKIAIIDDLVAWDGSLNILSYKESKERMTRWIKRTKSVGMEFCRNGVPSEMEFRAL